MAPIENFLQANLSSGGGNWRVLVERQETRRWCIIEVRKADGIKDGGRSWVEKSINVWYF